MTIFNVIFSQVSEWNLPVASIALATTFCGLQVFFVIKPLLKKDVVKEILGDTKLASNDQKNEISKPAEDLVKSHPLENLTEDTSELLSVLNDMQVTVSGFKLYLNQMQNMQNLSFEEIKVMITRKDELGQFVLEYKTWLDDLKTNFNLQKGITSLGSDGESSPSYQVGTINETSKGIIGLKRPLSAESLPHERNYFNSLMENSTLSESESPFINLTQSNIDIEGYNLTKMLDLSTTILSECEAQLIIINEIVNLFL